MVLFDLNNVRGTAVSAHAQEFHPSAFQGDVLSPVKSVKRLAHPWPFPAREGSDPSPPESGRSAQLDSSFVT